MFYHHTPMSTTNNRGANLAPFCFVVWYNIPIVIVNTSYLIFLYYFKPFMEKRKDTEKRKLQKQLDDRISYHHIINKSRKELFDNLYDEQNLKKWKWWPHRKRHEAHLNEHPLETLQEMKRFMQVMSEEAKELYQTLISMDITSFYSSKFLPWK